MVKADLGGVRLIERETLSPWSAISIAQELEIPQAIQIVAEAPDTQIVGWCACRVIWPEAELLKIAVKKNNRKQGIGRLLVEHLVGELQKRKISSLFLEVRSNNYTALNFYHNHNFLHVGSRPGYYTDPPDSAMVLKKNLSS
jgi:ribosomal-protein-alanine N-acetyltransferase